jgi:small nuclear ribonucleoprotein (snRNP)-like protein
MQNKVVIHYRDGRILKGTTHDVLPHKSTFHATDKETGQTVEVELSQLKAVFFVKTYEGDREYAERDDVERSGMGRKIQVTFEDGETLIGYTQGYSQNRPAFFLFPSDPKSNNDRILVVTDAAESVKFL